MLIASVGRFKELALFSESFSQFYILVFQGRCVGQWLRNCLRRWRAVSAPFQFLLPADVQPGKAQVTTDTGGSLLPTWEAWLEFPVPGLGLAQLLLY